MSDLTLGNWTFYTITVNSALIPVEINEVDDEFEHTSTEVVQSQRNSRKCMSSRSKCAEDIE